MRIPFPRLVPLVLLPLWLGACGGPAVLPDGTSVLRGEVVNDAGSRAGAATKLDLALVNVTKPGSRTEPVARERIDRPGGPPVKFQIVYNVRSLQPGHHYAVCARARDAAGDIVWATSELNPVKLPTDDRIRIPVTDERQRWAECRSWRE